MGPSQILSIVHTITIGTVLNFNSGNNEDGPKTLRVNSPLVITVSSKFQTNSSNLNLPAPTEKTLSKSPQIAICLYS